MDHITVLKRAWELLKRYRMLWIFGLMLALTALTLLTHANYGIDASGMPHYGFLEGGRYRPLYELLEREVSSRAWSSNIKSVIRSVGTILINVLQLVVIIGSPIVNYVSEVALIRMVDRHETTGEQLRFRQGWKLGWSREVWQLFLIDCVVFILGFVVLLVVLSLLSIPLQRNAPFALPAIIGIFFFTTLIINVVGAFCRLLIRFFRRRCVLEKHGVVDALDQGYALVKQHWKDVGLMWLITTGISIAWSVLLTPLAFLMIAAGVLPGDDYTLLVRGLVGLVMGNVGDWVVGAFTGIPMVILLFSIVVTFLNGLKEAFLSSAWTLTYRELRALDQLRPLPRSRPKPLPGSLTEL